MPVVTIANIIHSSTRKGKTRSKTRSEEMVVVVAVAKEIKDWKGKDKDQHFFILYPYPLLVTALERVE